MDADQRRRAADAEREARSVKLRRARLPEARRFDRNCVLAATAGQIIAANELGLSVSQIIVGESPFGVGNVAYNIKLAAHQIDRRTAIIAIAGAVGFLEACG